MKDVSLSSSINAMKLKKDMWELVDKKCRWKFHAFSRWTIDTNSIDGNHLF